jgi:signal peptidase II
MSQGSMFLQQKAKVLSYLALAAILIGSLGIDRFTKTIAERELKAWSSPSNLREYQGNPHPVFQIGQEHADKDHPKFFLGFNLNYVRNQGAAWGMFSNVEDSIRVPFFHVVTLIAVLIILLYLRSTPLQHRLVRFALVLILSGALGNFWDRIMLGYVIDFLEFRWIIPFPFHLHANIDFFPKILEFLNIHIDSSAWSYHFPNFNWADSMISTGVFFLIFDMIFFDPVRQKSNPSDNTMKGQVSPL